MYLRETRRTNRDGSVVSYLQLAHNERHPVTGNPIAKVIHNFGRAEQVDRAALARLVSLDLAVPDPGAGRAPPRPRAARGRGAGLAPPGWGVDVGPGLGTARDRRGDPPGRGRAAPGRRGGRAGGVRAGRAAGAGAGLEAGRDRVGGRAGRDRGLPGVQRRRRVRGRWTSCSTRLDEIAAEIFASVAHLLNLDLDIVFVDTTSTYWETDDADELADLADDRRRRRGQPARPRPGRGRSGTPRTTAPTCRRW